MTNKKRGLGKINGFSIQFLPYSEIKDLDSTERIKKILGIILNNNILILQGRLAAVEEARLIGDTMAMVEHVKELKELNLQLFLEVKIMVFGER
jgi:hypothetical protein